MAKRMVWSIVNAIVDAWCVLMCALTLPGAKMGFWRMRWVKESNGAPVATQKLYDAIMWTGIVITSALMGLGIVKILILRGVI